MKLMEMKKKIQERFPGKRVFIPPVVSAILLRENDTGGLVRMKPGETVPVLEVPADKAME